MIYRIRQGHALMLFILLLLSLFISGCTGEIMVTTKNTKSDTTNIFRTNITEYVTKQCGTEPAFNNAYWNEHRPGIYVDVNTGEALFSSIDKFDSGTGWPSFTKPILNASIEEKPDDTLGIQRTKVRTNASHLGHIFDDGPDGNSRYCINSAALRFVPYENLADEGYGEYEKLFSYEKTILAGGCFWGVEKLLEEIPGVLDAVSGYTGGTTENPTYEQVITGKTGHYESVQIVFDPNIISYSEILDYFWRLHDPTQTNGQGPDIGTQYRSAIFYYNEEQKAIAIASKKNFDAKKIFSKPAATQILSAGPFYKAEAYHQDYYDKHPDLVCHALRKE
jgi:peptide methionine sulfoxide reductase msrA/msrB